MQNSGEHDWVRIPFNKPCLEGGEVQNIVETVASGKLAGDGKFNRLCHTELERLLNARKVFLTPSCTAALEMAALLYNIGPGDEVIMPSYTFVSTATAFCLRGARPVFVDIRPDTLNLDERLIPAAITERTKAIVPVHYAGVACEMDAIVQLAAAHDIRVIEDAAQGVLATYHGRALGTLGDAGCFSFHETKTIMSGEGGAIVLNREEDIERADILREKGTNRTAFFHDEVEKYTWVDLGSSYLPSDLIGAFLYGQITARDRILAKRRAIHERYDALLAPLVDRDLLTTIRIPGHCTVNFHMYYVLVTDAATRTALLAHLHAAGIWAVFHYIPLHTSPYAQQLGIDVQLPVTDDIAARLIRLPFYNDLHEDQQAHVASSIAAFFHA